MVLAFTLDDGMPHTTIPMQGRMTHRVAAHYSLLLHPLWGILPEFRGEKGIKNEGGWYGPFLRPKLKKSP